jgi:hypothetical protein
MDIGVRFACEGDAPEAIEFLAPVRWASSRTFSDLSQEVLDEAVSDLIFGSSVGIADRTVNYTQSATPISEEVLIVDQLQDVGDGRLRAVLTRPQTKLGAYYVRFRYECERSARLIQSKGWGFAKRGWVFDLRINDVRETVGLPREITADRMLDVESAYVFVVAPNAYIPALVSPDLTYTRLLELQMWRGYLASCRHVWKDRKSTIYYWRSEAPASKPVTAIKPMRTYMHLHREFGWTIFVLYGAGIVALPWISSTLKWLTGLVSPFW